MTPLHIGDKFLKDDNVYHEIKFKNPCATASGFDDAAIRPSTRKTRGRYWLAFLFLRITGARLGEVLALNDVNDIDHWVDNAKLVTLKRHAKTDHAGRKTKSVPVRLVPVPPSIISELATYLAQYPDQLGRVESTEVV